MDSFILKVSRKMWNRESVVRKVIKTFLFLLNKKFVCAEDLAKHLNCSRRQARRYLVCFEECCPIQIQKEQSIEHDEDSRETFYYSLDIEFRKKHKFL